MFLLRNIEPLATFLVGKSDFTVPREIMSATIRNVVLRSESHKYFVESKVGSVESNSSHRACIEMFKRVNKLLLTKLEIPPALPVAKRKPARRGFLELDPEETQSETEDDHES